MRRFPWFVVLACLLSVPLLGCATCPDGRCASRQMVDECCDDGCSHCGSDGIMSNGLPCRYCGPGLGTPWCGKPVRTYFRNMLTCGGGCSGEVYWDEWYCDPPACCDPCEDLGACRRRGLFASCWDAIAGGACGDGSCNQGGGDVCCVARNPRAMNRRMYEEGTASEFHYGPDDPPPAPPTVSPDNRYPDQKAYRTRRVIRR